MNVERLQQLATQYPEVQELLSDNYSLSVALLAKRIEDRLALFDGNHTRAQAKLVDELKALEERTKRAVAGLHKRIKALESQNTDRTLAQGRIMETLQKFLDRIEKLESTKEPAEATP